MIPSLAPRHGLSPLARGTREIVGKNPWLTRFIPAGAVSPVDLAVKIGLSPLARGTREIVGKNPWLTRFIPAGAGNTRP
ncbi:hypothetical protein SA46_2328 [Salmonella enterica subsp. enterica serovar Agona str. 46.E.09]|nr:hypothetical protein SA46_2328 [Salmonella enterica subsp. enterica serovar Agona str. 46.E.09]